MLFGKYTSNRRTKLLWGIRILWASTGSRKTLGSERSARFSKKLRELLVSSGRHYILFCHKSQKKAN
jgi:hypothetical protein